MQLVSIILRFFVMIMCYIMKGNFWILRVFSVRDLDSFVN